MLQKTALNILKSGHNVFITGAAGSGKTHLLNQYIKYLHEHDIPVAVTASTGIAATHMNGMTIHGFTGIGIKDKLTEYDLDSITQKPYLIKRFERTKVLIIDEISMLSSRTFDMVELVCRTFKRNNLPFGGLQVILSGDFFQLPPVIKGEISQEDTLINSKSFKAMKPVVCYLSEQHRQEDEIFLSVLNAMRKGNLSEEHKNHVKKRIDAKIAIGNPTKLYTHNVDVDAINNAELAKLPGVLKTFEMTSKGRDILVEILKKSCLAQGTLCLKIGAEVMFIKNNFELGYVNGTRGVVVQFLPDGTPVVKTMNGKKIVVPIESWAIEEDGKCKASVEQLPLRLAWAITIHKSQGMSLDHAEIDLSKTFTYGMGYVALSRVRTLAGIRLVGFQDSALVVDPKILEFDKTLQKESQENEKLFEKLSAKEQNKLEKDFIALVGGSVKKIRSDSGKKIPTIFITKEMLDEGKSISVIAKERNLTEDTILAHIEKLLMNENEKISIEHIRPSEKEIKLVRECVEKNKGDSRLSVIKNTLEKTGHDLSYSQIRLARLFL